MSMIFSFLEKPATLEYMGAESKSEKLPSRFPSNNELVEDYNGGTVLNFEYNVSCFSFKDTFERRKQ